MTNPTDNTEDSLNPLLGNKLRQSVPASAQSSRGEQSVFASDSMSNGSEKLLNINGLLKIVELINGIKKDGRWRVTNDELSGQTE
jgi:hypothetical protein